MRGSNNKIISIVDKIIITFIHINEKPYSTKFYMLDSLKYDVILGYEFLTEFNVILDLKLGIVKIAENNINIIGFHKESELKEEEGPQIINNLTINNETDIKFNDTYNIDCNNDILKNKLIELFKNNMHLIDNTTCFAKNFVYNFDINHSVKFKPQMYNVPYKYKDDVIQEVENLLKSNIISLSTSCYLSPLVCVRKPNGSIRLCLDTRFLNSLVEKESTSPESLDSLFAKISSCKIFSKLDLKHSFHLIALHPNCRKYFSFSLNGRVYSYNCLPFGYCNSASVLIKALRQVLDHLPFVSLYVDDIIIFSRNESDHFEHVSKVLNILADNNFKLNIEKSSFFKSSVVFLGFVISTEGISMEKSKLEAIKNFPRPQTVKQVRSFLGTVNYYARFIPKMAEILVPLYDLLKKQVRFKWSEKHENAYNEIKSSLHERFSLIIPDFNSEFFLNTDASGDSLAGFLYQIVDNQERPIAFLSKRFNPTQKKYSINEREMLAIIYSIHKLKFYLIGNKFTINTDNQSLIAILKCRPGNLNGRIYRWYLYLQKFKFDINYIPSKKNFIADCFSRSYVSSSKERNSLYINYHNLQNTNDVYFNKDVILGEQRNATELNYVFDNLQNANVYKGFEIRDGLLVKQFKRDYLIYLPKAYYLKVAKYLHDDIYGHLGCNRLHLILRENFICKKDTSLVKEVVRNCHKCKVAKSKNYSPTAHAYTPVWANQMFELVSVDFLSNLITSGNHYKNILVIVDNFTKYIRLYPTKNCTTTTVINCIKEYLNSIPIKPRKLLTDLGTCFTSPRFLKFLKKHNIQKVNIPCRSAKTNICERQIQNILKLLRIYCYDTKHSDWVYYLHNIEYILNHTANTVTRIAPITLVYKTYPDRPWVNSQNNNSNPEINIDLLTKEIQFKLNKLHNKNREKYKKNHKNNKEYIYNVGELVLVKRHCITNKKLGLCKKLDHKFDTFKVIEKKGQSTYLLESIDNAFRQVYGIENIYPY